ncbi:MAG: hypothetical protein HYU26_17165 [Candidatus Rokubacteria bacterium]|nr:hypothetical protein [Candidatus Rokubacteria bacterium]
MAYTSGKQAFLEILKSEGVSVMFGNPGTTELPLMDGLAREPGIHYVLALQEAVAIAMADGYAQAAGGLAAVNVHVSPGLGNAMGMLYDAMKSGAPMLLTAGQHDQSFNVTEPILWSDLPPIARPFVKWATEAHRLEDLPRLVRRAVKTAFAHPTGPVFLSLPVDVLNAERDLELGAPTRVAPRLRGDRHAVDEAARRLVRAERPVLIAGDAVAHGDALAEMVELAELVGAPVLLEGVSSTCSFPFTHPLYAGSMPRLGPPIRALLMRHDLLFSVGRRSRSRAIRRPRCPSCARPCAVTPARAARPARPGGGRRSRRSTRRNAPSWRAARGARRPACRSRPSRSSTPSRRPRPPTPWWWTNPSRRRPGCGPSSAAPTRRASTRCAAGASAGACRRRPGSSWRFATGPCWRSSATGARCTPTRPCGRPPARGSRSCT